MRVRYLEIARMWRAEYHYSSKIEIISYPLQFNNLADRPIDFHLSIQE